MKSNPRKNLLQTKGTEKKNIVVPLLLCVLAIAGVSASVIWKQDTTRFLESLNDSRDKTLPLEETATSETRKPLIALAAPSISWVTQPQNAAQNRIAMAFKIGASAPLRTVKISITPVVKLAGLDIDKEIMDVPTYFIGRKSLDWDGQIDLTGSLLAGTPVVLQITAQDSDKREGTSETVSITLPEHSFNNPIAKAIYGLRKNLREDPQNKRLETLRGLAIILQQRATFENQGLSLMTLRSAAVRIALDKTNDGLRTALELMWHAAVLIEDSHPTSVAKS
jgi:hypothetical protein